MIFVLLSADKGLFALTKGLHQVYNFSGNNKKSVIYLKLISILKTIIFIVMIVVGLVILVFGRTIRTTLQERFGMIENYTIISEILTNIVYVCVTFILFLCVYKYIPSYKITFKSQIRGAVFGAIALNVLSFAFAKYLEIFKGFSITYGSLTALMIIMMWTYFCFYIIFLGAEINKFYSIKKINNEKELIAKNDEKGGVKEWKTAEKI